MIVQLIHQTYGIREIKFARESGETGSVVFRVDADHEIHLLDAEYDGLKWRVFSTSQARLYIDDVYQDDLVLANGASAMILRRVNDQIEPFVMLCHSYQNNNIYPPFPLFLHCPSKKSLTIGFEGCNINFARPFISSRHAVISNDNDILSIRDLDSRNGTYVNGRRVREQVLKSGDWCDLFGLRLVCLGQFLALVNFSGYRLDFYGVQPIRLEAEACGENENANLHLLDDKTSIDFDRTPRIYHKNSTFRCNVDAAPQPENQEQSPLMLTIGSSAMMSLSSIMMAMLSLQNLQASGASLISAVPSLLMALSMFSGSMLMPVITRKYEDKKRAHNEEERRSRYLNYLHNLDMAATEHAKQQKALLEQNYIDVHALCEAVQSLSSRMWERMPSHADFLDIRLGRSDQELATDMRIPEKRFELKDDVMRDALESFKNKKFIMENTPLMLSLRTTGILGVVAEYRDRLNFVTGLVTQLCCTHSYEEMKLALIYSEADSVDWEFARWFPHTWNDDKSYHFIGSTPESMHLLSAHLDGFMLRDNSHSEKNAAVAHCVVVVADTDLVEHCETLRQILLNKTTGTVSVIAMAGKNSDLPKNCHSVITVKNGLGRLYEHIDAMESPVQFHLDEVAAESIQKISMLMSNVRINSKEMAQLPNSITFFEMMRCGNVRQLNALQRWSQNNPVKSLAAPLGVDHKGRLVELDIHQNAHGPHGLIAGMTGSGKSEFIISYLLSMAVNYSPLEVGFVLIDYKGGGMSDTLKLLPHVLGTIDNLGGKQGIHRSMVSINSEILRRQAVFKALGEQMGENNMDIYRYQKMYRAGDVKEPMPHLLIVSDEFAELKQQEPAFMDDLVSAARIGRSLGVHLILATQKPTGVVNEQITSNSRFKICMKVQDRSDSQEMLGKPDAALLTQTGRFYMQVGFNEIYVLGQSAWSGADDDNTERFEKKVDDSIEILNDQGAVVMRVNNPANAKKDGAEKDKQVKSIVNYLHGLAEQLPVQPRKIWEKPLNEYEVLTLATLDETYSLPEERFVPAPIIGLVDNPHIQEQYPLRLDLKHDGNALLYGSAGTGKDEFINTMIYSLCSRHTPEEINVYCIDLAGETTRMFAALPHVGEIMVNGDDEKVANFVDMMEKEMVSRRKTLAMYGGDIANYRAESGAFFPDILIVVHNYPAFMEVYEDLSDRMVTLIRESERFGIYFVVTASGASSLRYKLTQNFKQVFCMQLADPSDYRQVLGHTTGTQPSERKGSGICRSRDNVVEFQVADMLELPEDASLFQAIKARCAEIAREWHGPVARRVPILPEVVISGEICPMPEVVELSRVPIGINEVTMEPESWNLSERDGYLISFDEEPEIPFLPVLLKVLAANEKRTVAVFDAAKQLHPPTNKKYRYYSSKNELVEGFSALICETLVRHRAVRAAEAENRPLPTFDEYVLLINGGKELYTSMPPEIPNPVEQMREETPMLNTHDYLETIFTCMRRELNMTIILSMGASSHSGMCAYPWYKQKMSGKNALWVGSGFNSGQMIIETGAVRGVGPKTGVLLRRGRAARVQLMEE